MANLMVYPKFRATDSSGLPLSSGYVWTYISGTSTPKTTYTDSGAGTPNANPVLLDSRGEASIWLDSDAAYTFEVYNSSNALQGTVNNILGFQTSVTGGISLSGNLQLKNYSITDNSSPANEYITGHTVAAATNKFGVYNAATAGRPMWVAEGDDTNVSGELRSQGTGGWYIQDGNANEVVVTASGIVAAKNYHEFTNSATTVGPTLAAKGDDINIDYNIAPKGTGAFGLTTGAYNGNKGANIASATSTAIGTATGDFVDVTGSTTITSFDTIKAGVRRNVRFTGALTLTHNATSLILPAAVNITTANGDNAVFISLGSGNWVCTSYQRASGLPVASYVIQTVNTQTGAVATGTTILPGDDTIPQNTEGDQYMTLAITPTSTTTHLLITVSVITSHSSASSINSVALFQDSTANALRAMTTYAPTLTAAGMVQTFSHYMVSGTTSATTFKVRCGSANAGTTTFNGFAAVRYLGGVLGSSITITEMI